MIITIQKYISELEARGLARNTIKAYKLVLTALNAYKPLESIQKDDLIGFFKQFKGTDSSRQLYVVIAKTYFKSIGKPEIASWMTVKKPKESLRSDEILTAEDVNKMIGATDSLYFKCLLALLYETGGRIDSELLQLRYSDFLQTEKGIVLTITTKKTDAGFRKMLIPLSENYYINLRDSIEHKPGDKVFTLKYRQTFEIIQEIGRRARITKPFHPHAFRHARATDEVRKGTQEAIIRKMLGWTANSGMIARYQQLNDEDIIDAQSNGTKKAIRAELKIVEKADITPVYEAIKQENASLRQEMDEMKKQQSAFTEEMVKAMIEARVKELLKK